MTRDAFDQNGKKQSNLSISRTTRRNPGLQFNLNGASRNWFYFSGRRF